MMHRNEADLLDPSLLEGLSEQERTEALAAAAAARRAEERAERRALERAMAEREAIKRQEQAQEAAQEDRNTLSSNTITGRSVSKVVFVSRKQRMAQQKVEQGEKKGTRTRVGGASGQNSSAAGSIPTVGKTAGISKQQDHHNLSHSELSLIKQSYLGKRSTVPTQEEEAAKVKQRRKDRSKKKITFKFEWDATEDTSRLQEDEKAMISALNSRKKKSRISKHKDAVATMDSAMTKPLNKMTPRDWRIFRENYDIMVKGGKTPPPLRSFREASPELPSLHPALLDAIENVLKYKDPSPIQRQAIPIGLQRRDLIGVAETGSGKTAAFGIPLCHYLLHLRSEFLDRVATEGPLALVMAPTRELAIQIEEELSKLLSKQSTISTFCVVGGQPIQQQAYRLRQGVHIVVGTPGRINDCVEMAYLVLNQCCYMVMDEADRMIDLGFAPQMEKILDAMGGLLKSEDEALTYQQEMEDLKRTDILPRHRLTAMFSATMPSEVERLAKRYLRHPAVISIGDQDSGKNARISQRIIFLSAPSQKEKALRELLSRGRNDDKIIVFVNEKKHADGIGRMVERMGRRCVVLHGGKSQEIREENLDMFKRGGVVLVATDVAGRGLDIPNVTHVINYDLPSRSIENYTHRIGRTGRAGKAGLATSFLTEEDTTIMAPLKNYLESTGNPVPDKLARHPAANVGATGSHIT